MTVMKILFYMSSSCFLREKNKKSNYFVIISCFVFLYGCTFLSIITFLNPFSEADRVTADLHLSLCFSRLQAQVSSLVLRKKRKEKKTETNKTKTIQNTKRKKKNKKTNVTTLPFSSGSKDHSLLKLCPPLITLFRSQVQHLLEISRILWL